MRSVIGVVRVEGVVAEDLADAQDCEYPVKAGAGGTAEIKREALTQDNPGWSLGTHLATAKNASA
jgi:hypothetical protein